MRYRQITIENTAVGTISPAQYDRLRAEGYRVHGNGSVKTVYTPRSVYDAERPEARAYIHQKFHQEYPELFCYYDGCEKSAEMGLS